MKTCKYANCPNPATRKGLCTPHYMKEYRRKQKAKPTYEEGIQEGINITVEALDKLLIPHGGHCSFWGITLAIELQGKVLKTNLDVS